MTELEKRLKHIEKTNAKRTNNYIKHQQQAEEKFNIIRDREKSKYLNPNLEKETKKAMNSDVTLQDTNLNNYKTVKSTVDNYVSQRNRNDENVRVFTPQRNQAKSNRIVNNIYSNASFQAEDDEYNSKLSSLEKQKESLENQKKEIDKKKRRYYSSEQKENVDKINEQLSNIKKETSTLKSQHNTTLYEREKSLIYANNGVVANTLQDYSFAIQGEKMKGTLTSNSNNDKLSTLMPGRDKIFLEKEGLADAVIADNQKKQQESSTIEALKENWEAYDEEETKAIENEISQKKKDIQSQLKTIGSELKNEYPDDFIKYQLEIVDVSDYGKNATVTKNFNVNDYSQGAVKLLNEYAELQSELIDLDSAKSKVSIRSDHGAMLASENLEDNEETRLAIRVGIENTDNDDEDFNKLLTQYVREEDRIRFFYIRGRYGSEAAKSYALYAAEQANTSEGLQEAYENNTLEEFHNSASNGLLGFFEGWWDAADSIATQITGKEGILKSDYTRIDSASDVELQKDKEQAGAVKSFLLDLTNTTANQLPSIVLTLATGSAGAGMVSQSVSAAGNAYSEALMEGKSTDEAFLYGGVQGLMEFATEKILGGQYGMNGALEKYGSEALENVMPKLIKNETFATYAKQAGKILINSAGEFNEEAIQQLLEPYIRNITFGEDNKQTRENVEDALYNGLLGMASAGLTNTTGEVTSGVVNGVSNKLSNARISEAKGSEVLSNLNTEQQASNNTNEKQVLSNTNENQAINETNNNQNTSKSENTETPTVESVVSEAESNQETANRITKIIDKIDNGETVTDSEITEIKYNETASDMLGQMAGLKENKITSDLDNETVRAVINEAQNGKKNIDTVSILSNIRSKTKSTLNTAPNTNEIASSDVLTANEGNLTNTNQRALQDVAETSMPSQLSESTEAVTENIAGNAERNYINNTEADNLTVNQQTLALNDSSYIENVSNSANAVNKVENNSNKILQLGISNEKTGSANIRKVESVDNGVAQLLMTNGEVVSADTLDFSGNQNAEIILTNAGKYNSSTANTFISNYDSSISTAQEYSTAFNSVYKMAETGVRSEAIASRAAGARTVLGEKDFNAAIRAGRNTAKGVFSDGTSSKAKNTAKTTNNKKSVSKSKSDNTHKTKKTDEAPRTDRSAFKLNTSSANNNVSQKSKTVNVNTLKNTDNDTKFSIDPEFEAKYDSWDKKNQHKVFTLGKTSNALKSIGLSDKTITMDSSKILKIKKKHSAMTDNIIKDIPKILENPIAIMKSKTKNNRITMFGSLTDANGKPVLAVLELNPIKYGYKLNEYKVASAYGKDNLQNLINTSEILYIDNKKRTTDLLNETRLQLPSTFNKGSSYNNSISKNNNTVNNSIFESSDNDTKTSIENKTDVEKSAKEFSKALGVKINVYQSDSSIRGYYQNGEIYINESFVNKKADSSSEFNYILAHELTHSLEESKHYNELKEFILDSQVYDNNLKSRDTTHTEEVIKRQELYEKYGKELTTEQAEQELIADFIADELLTNEESIKELAYKDKKLFVKVKEFVNKLIERIKNITNKSSNITKAQKDLIHIKGLYTKAFNDVKKNGTYSNEIKYSKKLGGYNPEINVTTDNVLKEYGIKNINNKYEVYNKVSSKLSKSYLSTNEIHKPITNIDTGLKIEIRKSGIKETFGNSRYYDNLTDDLKLAKIASMSELAKMIKYGEVRAKDSSNYHNPRSETKFSYLKSSINIDGINYDITMDIKRLPNNDNIFYIHALKIKKQEANSLRRISSNALKENLPLADNNISQKNDIVNTNIRKNSDNDTKTESQKELREFVSEHYDVLKKAYDIMEKFNALDNKQNDSSASGNSVDNQRESGIINTGIPYLDNKKNLAQHEIQDCYNTTNPNYNLGIEYKVNCQRCVSAYEARRRGIDVTAKAAIMDRTDTLPYMMNPRGWANVYENGLESLETVKGITCKKIKDNICSMMREYGDGARAIIRVQWQGRNSGHVFIAEQVNGVTQFIDPQSSTRDVLSYFNKGMIKPSSTRLLRIDNKRFTDLIEECVK